MPRSPFQPTGAMTVSWRALGEQAFAPDRGMSGSLGGWDAAAAVVDLTDPRERRLGDYELLEELGRGGMGVVYRARQRSLDREVALKLLAGSLWTRPDAAARFAAEAASAARMQHPGIVAIHEFGAQDERFFYSMELVHGTDLGAHLREHGPLAEREACRLVRDLARAVHYAHALNILHLDLKPQNVLIEAGGRARIADFGLARPLDRAASGEQAETVAGTPSYMAPEQALLRAADISRATDVYGLGAILYECLTGEPPFQGASVDDTLRAVAEAPLTLPRARRRALSRDVEAVCLKCLQRDPAQRYASAEELAEDLGRLLDGNPVQARRMRWSERAWRWLAREPVTLGGLATAGAILVAAAVAWTAQYERTARTERLASDAFAATADALLALPPGRPQLEALVAVHDAAFPLANKRSVAERLAFHGGLRDALVVRRGASHPLAHELALYLADDRRLRDTPKWKAALRRQDTPMATLLDAMWHEGPYRADDDQANLFAGLAASLDHPQPAGLHLTLSAWLCSFTRDLRPPMWTDAEAARCAALEPRVAEAAQLDAFNRLLARDFDLADHAAFLAALQTTPFVDPAPALYRETLATLEPIAREVAGEDLASGLTAREIAALAARHLVDEFLFAEARQRALLPCRELQEPVPAERAAQCRASIAAMRKHWTSFASRFQARVQERRLEMLLAGGSVPRPLPPVFDFDRRTALLACCSRHQAHPEWVRRRADEGDLAAYRWLYAALGEDAGPMLSEGGADDGN